MSMSTEVIGIRPADEKWKKMKAVWDSCKKAGIEPPEAVDDFFDGEEPNPDGIEVEIKSHPYNASSMNGFDVHLSELPKDVKIIRFYNAY
jgi:hypothetical protein